MPAALHAIAGRLPARSAMRLRAAKNRKDLFGLYAPARLFSDLVPRGSVAVDAGAAHGLYTHFMAKRAAVVHAFEPNPHMYRRLDQGAGRKIIRHHMALSDRAGWATLHVPPAGFGEASLHEHPERGAELMQVDVETRTLDSFDLHGVGFLKVDVEGHELPLLRGALKTLRSQKPGVFIELEERHAPGALDQARDLFGQLGYTSMHFLYRGAFQPIADFDLERHQLGQVHAVSSPDYVCNFLFRA